ncbi:hypothetical protein PG995_005593 [Apiospora arundinis]
MEKDQLQMLSTSLPDILEDFAFRIGQEDPEATCCRLMYLVHRYKLQIVEVITKSFVDEEEDMAEPLEPNSMPLDDKMSLWMSKDDLQETQAHDTQQWGPDPTSLEDFEDIAPELQEYSDIILHSPAYAWLQDAIHKIFNMVVDDDMDMHKEIRQTVLAAIYQDAEAHVSPRRRPTTHTLQFQLPWIMQFLESQEYSGSLAEVLPHVIVLTGSGNRIWASTCQQYLSSVWPNTGAKVLELFQTLLHEESSYIDRDDVKIAAQIQRSEEDILFVRVRGVLHAIAEIATILTWLCGALRASAWENCTAMACPTFVFQGRYSMDDNSQHVFGNEVFMFQITQDHQLEVRRDIGTCWTGLYGNPVVVNGFMTPRHQAGILGCYMSLGMMAALVNTRKISTFGGRIIIKGFSTALVPTGKKDGCVMWHTVVNDDGDYMSFSDSRIKSLSRDYPSGLTIGDLQTSRHVVGWCTEAKSNIGSRSANYEVGWSGLMKTRPGCAFDKVSITGGQFITGGVSCILGKKDKPVHVRIRDDYTMRLKWIAKKFVVFYDTTERRAWLFNGISALLHLVRASLKQDSTDDFQSHFLFRESELQEPPPCSDGKAAAIHVLTNRHNTALPLYSQPDSLREEFSGPSVGQSTSVITRTKTDYCLKDRIESICGVLEQIMAHQADVASEDGVGLRIKSTTRRQLEGFDFMDVATDEDPLWPRVMTLRSGGKGWVDLTRAIHAITLFGSGFGDLIEPTGSNQIGRPPSLGGLIPPADPSPIMRLCRSCNFNVQVPKFRDYLAVCVSDILEIMQRRGSRNTTPWRLVDDLYWHAPDQPFEACRCAPTEKFTDSHGTDRVQVLLPATFPKLWGRGLGSPWNLEPGGALLFGHSKRFPFRWRDKGDPEVGQPEDEPSIEELGLENDSGIGTSVGASSDAAPGNSPVPPESASVEASPVAHKHPQPATLSYDSSSNAEEEPSGKRLKLFGRFLGLA